MTALIVSEYWKALDYINFEILISILHYVDFWDGSVTLLGLFIRKIEHIFRIGNDISNHLSTQSGVPQGSILESTLYLIYTAFF